MSDLSLIEPHELDPISFVLGHGETLVGHWYVQGHALVRVAKAMEAQEPGTDVTGKDVAVDPDVPCVWLMFEDAAAVRRMGEYLLLVVAKGLLELVRPIPQRERTLMDNPTYCCDRCQVPVELLQLVKMGKEYVCRFCYDKLHQSVRPIDARDVLPMKPDLK